MIEYRDLIWCYSTSYEDDGCLSVSVVNEFDNGAYWFIFWLEFGSVYFGRWSLRICVTTVSLVLRNDLASTNSFHILELNAPNGSLNYRKFRENDIRTYSKINALYCRSFFTVPWRFIGRISKLEFSLVIDWTSFLDLWKSLTCDLPLFVF